MRRGELETRYLDWMYRLVYEKEYTGGLSYRSLFRHLHSVEFTYAIEMDGNRASDGVALRRQFICERQIHPSVAEGYFEGTPCSVLEMMVALSLRCEDHIMGDSNLGDRTGKWFWGMIDNLGLLSMPDTKFDALRADIVIDTLLYREYMPNGQGGLFTVEHSRMDLRDVEIWYQMCWYLNSIYRNE